MVDLSLAMDVNGESMGKRWQKETPVPERTTVAPWPGIALFENKYAILIYAKDGPQRLGSVHFESNSCGWTTHDSRIILGLSKFFDSWVILIRHVNPDVSES